MTAGIFPLLRLPEDITLAVLNKTNIRSLTRLRQSSKNVDNLVQSRRQNLSVRGGIEVGLKIECCETMFVTSIEVHGDEFVEEKEEVMKKLAGLYFNRVKVAIVHTEDLVGSDWEEEIEEQDLEAQLDLVLSFLSELKPVCNKAELCFLSGERIHSLMSFIRARNISLHVDDFKYPKPNFRELLSHNVIQNSSKLKITSETWKDFPENQLFEEVKYLKNVELCLKPCKESLMIDFVKDLSKSSSISLQQMTFALRNLNSFFPVLESHFSVTRIFQSKDFYSPLHAVYMIELEIQTLLFIESIMNNCKKINILNIDRPVVLTSFLEQIGMKRNHRRLLIKNWFQFSKPIK